ncbi:MAG TPA: Calx-beta domain-containing protein [Candidatus Binatia bacterium]|nr:Calx-beta domain-containing protein [Candidatus Binatia bacterium]
MKEAAGYISRLMCQIAGQLAQVLFRTTEASRVVVGDKINRSSRNRTLADLAHHQKPRAHAVLSAIACTGLALTGCGGHGTTDPPSAQKIGAAGGTVTEASGAKVVVPAGALTQDTPITVSQTSAGAPPLPAGVTAVGPIYAFTPHGTSFAVPATITVPFEPASVPGGTTPVLYKTNAAQSAWDVVSGASVSASTMVGNVSGFSFAVVATPPTTTQLDPPFRTFATDVYTAAETRKSVTIPDTGTNGVLNVAGHIDGPLALAPPPLTENEVTHYIFSNATGRTFWTQSVAPSETDPPHDIGSRTSLTQTFYFRVDQEKPNMHFLITHASLEGIDNGGHTPDDRQICRWLPESHTAQDVKDKCDGYMTHAEDSFRLEARSFGANGIFYRQGGHVKVTGIANDWTVDVSGDESSQLLWLKNFFTLDDDVDHTGAHDHYRLQLAKPLQVEVPIDSLHKNDIFSVEITIESIAINHIQGESFIAALTRDPLQGVGIDFDSAGVTQIPPRDDIPNGLPPLTCAAGPDPAAGTLQFTNATLNVPEPTDRAAIYIERTGGTKGEVGVKVTTHDGTATTGSDYETVSTEVRFGDGEDGLRRVDIPLVNDDVAESDESFTVTLSDVGGCAQLGAQKETTLTILDDDNPIVTSSFTLGGTVSGLAGGGLVIKDQISGGTASPSSDGAFTLSSPTPILDGFAYRVFVATQPTNPDQSCTVTNGNGTVTAANVTNITVNCVSSVPSGALDPTFGNGGCVTTTIGYSPGIVDARMGMALQTDGKILMVGGTALARFNPDGTLDSGFGSGGQVAVPFNQSGLDTAQDVAVQADGKIVVVGLTTSTLTFNDDFALARFNADGTLDASFGSGGKVTTDFFGSVDQARRVRIMPDGKILVEGSAVKVISSTTSVRHFALARYNPDGSLDTGFGNGGKVDEAAGASFSLARGMAFQSDGKIIVAGSGAADGVSDPDVAITRLFGDGGMGLPGTRDDSFGPLGKGFDLTDLGLGTSYEAGVDVVTLADDTIFVAAEVEVGPAAGGGGLNSQFTLVSFDPNDNQRRPQPAIIPITNQSDRPTQMLLQSDGKAVIVGRSGDLSSNADMAIVRFNAGALSTDPSFGTNGVLTVDFFGGRDGAEAVVQQPDGKLVAGGFARVGTGIVFALVRITP